MTKKLLFLLITVFAAQFNAIAAVSYTEDFSASSSLPNNTSQAYVGGWFGSLATFDTIAVATKSQINTSTEVLEVRNDTQNAFRGIGIVINPDTIGGAGDYNLMFDITKFNADSLDSADVSVWAGSGYQANSGNALRLNADIGQLERLGAATSSILTSESYTGTGTEFTLTFNYDGTSVLAVFFGSSSGGFPHPEVDYDNISISSVPEPSSSAYLALLTGAMLVRRSR